MKMPNIVTIEMLIQGYYIGGLDEEQVKGLSESKRNAARWLMKHEMLNDQYMITEKGKVWVEFIKEIPIPESTTTFQIPSQD